MKKVLCVCIGNSDRSPVMAAVLEMFLKSAGKEITCESVGVGDSAAQGGSAAGFATAAAKRLGLDISGHNRRHISAVNLDEYDLIVCVSDEIASQVMTLGVPLRTIYNAQIVNPWPVHFEQDYEGTMTSILGAMYKVIARYYSS